MKSLALAFVLSASCQAGFVPEARREPRSPPLTSRYATSFLDEPFGGANPVFSKMREKKIYSPGTAVIVERGEVKELVKETTSTVIAAAAATTEKARTSRKIRLESAETATKKRNSCPRRTVRDSRAPFISAKAPQPSPSRAKRAQSASRQARSAQSLSGEAKTSPTPSTTSAAKTGETGRAMADVAAKKDAWEDLLKAVEALRVAEEEAKRSATSGEAAAKNIETDFEKGSIRSTKTPEVTTKATKATTKVADVAVTPATDDDVERDFRKASAVSTKTTESPTKAAEATKVTKTTASRKDRVTDSTVAKPRTFVAGTDSSSVRTSASASFGASQKAHATPNDDNKSSGNDTPLGKTVVSGDPSRLDRSRFLNAKEYEEASGAVFCVPWESVGGALEGAGDALVSDTQNTRRTFASWMMLEPAWLLFGGDYGMFGELVVSAIVALTVRDANRVQKQAMEEEEAEEDGSFDAAREYDEDGWWGEVSHGKSCSCGSCRGQAPEFLSSSEREPSMKKPVVKVVKKSFVTDILGRRSFHHPQADVSEARVEQEWSSRATAAKETLELEKLVEEDVAAQMHEEDTARAEIWNRVVPSEAETSRTEFESNYMLPIENNQPFFPSKKGQFRKDIRAKRKFSP